MKDTDRNEEQAFLAELDALYDDDDSFEPLA
jgi:hypothetical protein